MYCPSCGAELRAEDKFCRQCGTQIRLPNNAEFQPQTTARSRPDRAKSQWWAAALSIVLLVPILGYLGVLVKGRIWKPQGLEGFVPYNPSSLKAESTPVLRGTSLRIYQPGDHWTYTSSVQLTQPDGTTQTGTGRLNNGIYVSTLDGKPVLTEGVRTKFTLQMVMEWNMIRIPIFSRTPLETTRKLLRTKAPRTPCKS